MTIYIEKELEKMRKEIATEVLRAGGGYDELVQDAIDKKLHEAYRLGCDKVAADWEQAEGSVEMEEYVE